MRERDERRAGRRPRASAWLALAVALFAGSPANGQGAGAWWQRPGFGVMYQIEWRPGWAWERDFNDFSAWVVAEGEAAFPRLTPDPAGWVRLSETLGVDYHIMEVKWHDGICFFDTALTKWKTAVDYTGQFADASRAAGIPFMLYYSSLIDHNPMFDAIQPDATQTLSLIASRSDLWYELYMRGQYIELIEKYRPDGLWLDWWWGPQFQELAGPEWSTMASVEDLLLYHQDTVFTFNQSNDDDNARVVMHYTSGEAPRLESAIDAEGITFGAWDWANTMRRRDSGPWELVGPTGRDWQVPDLRDDPYELVRMVAVTMASGGSYVAGATSQVDGAVMPSQQWQLQLVGDWYRPRKALFAQAESWAYPSEEPPGLTVSGGFRVIASRLGGKTLLHLINFAASEDPVSVRIEGELAAGLGVVYVEPAGTPLPLYQAGDAVEFVVPARHVDAVDTILRLVPYGG